MNQLKKGTYLWKIYKGPLPVVWPIHFGKFQYQRTPVSNYLLRKPTVRALPMRLRAKQKRLIPRVMNLSTPEIHDIDVLARPLGLKKYIASAGLRAHWRQIVTKEKVPTWRRISIATETRSTTVSLKIPTSPESINRITFIKSADVRLNQLKGLTPKFKKKLYKISLVPGPLKEPAAISTELAPKPSIQAVAMDMKPKDFIHQQSLEFDVIAPGVRTEFEVKPATPAMTSEFKHFPTTKIAVQEFVIKSMKTRKEDLKIKQLAKKKTSAAGFKQMKQVKKIKKPATLKMSTRSHAEILPPFQTAEVQNIGANALLIFALSHKAKMRQQQDEDLI